MRRYNPKTSTGERAQRERVDPGWCSTSDAQALGGVMGGDDLVRLEEAARAVGRSVATVRRWVRDGALEVSQGPPPRGGGRAGAWVSLRAVQAYAVVSGLPAEPQGGQPSRPTSPPVEDLRLEVATLRGENVGLRAEVRALREALEDTRAERDRWCEQAQRASAAAFALQPAVPFWRRLLGG